MRSPQKSPAGVAAAVIVCLLLLVAGFAVLPGRASAQKVALTPGDIQLVVDGRRVVPDVPPQLLEGRTMVPLRFVGEALGLEVTWDSGAQRVSLSGSNRDLTLVIDSRVARVDGAYRFIDVPPQLLMGRTMVPLRFVAESLGLAVSWQASTQTVDIEPPGADAPASSTGGAAAIDMSQLPLGETEARVLAAWGTPSERYAGFYGVERWIYRQADDQLMMLAFRAGTLVAGYSLGDGWSYRKAGRAATPSTVQNEMGIGSSMTLRLGKGQYTFHCERDDWGTLPPLLDQGHVVVFYTDTVDNRVPAVLVLDPHEFMITNPLRRSGCSMAYNTSAPPPPTVTLSATQQSGAERGEARLLLDLVNTERSMRGFVRLAWNARVADVAASHSRDMALNGFFSHTSPTTGPPADRLKAAGISALGFGENIAEGYDDAIATHHAWMNSSGHRHNILQPDFREYGAGAYQFSFTEDFLLTK